MKRFDTAFMNLHDCKGCNACWSNGHACAHPDDFGEIEPYLECCDTLVIISPMYWFHWTANIQMIIDKLYAYGGAGGDRPLAIKDSMFMICGADTSDEYGPVQEAYKMISSYCKWNDRGMLTCGGFYGDHKIEDSDVLAKAEAMGRNL